MKKALIIVSLTCCILSAKAQDFKKHGDLRKPNIFVTKKDRMCYYL